MTALRDPGGPSPVHLKEEHVGSLIVRYDNIRGSTPTGIWVMWLGVACATFVSRPNTYHGKPPPPLCCRYRHLDVVSLFRPLKGIGVHLYIYIC